MNKPQKIVLVSGIFAVTYLTVGEAMGCGNPPDVQLEKPAVSLHLDSSTSSAWFQPVENPVDFGKDQDYLAIPSCRTTI